VMVRLRAEVFAFSGTDIYGGFYPDGSFGVPGGGVDNGEELISAAEREFEEETGLVLEWIRTAKEPAFTSPWVEVPSERGRQKWERRVRQYPDGHSTHYFIGEVGEEAFPRPFGSLSQLEEVGFHPLERVIELQEEAILKAEGRDVLRMVSRLRVLREIRMELGVSGTRLFGAGNRVSRDVDDDLFFKIVYVWALTAGGVEKYLFGDELLPQEVEG